MTKREVTQLGYDIIAAAIKVNKTIGPGLLESVYEKCLKHELEINNKKVENQVTVPVKYGDIEINTNLRLDLLVSNTIVVELKTVETLNGVHRAQLLTYMKLLKKPKGILINFYTDNIVDEAEHYVNEYFKNLN